MAIKPVAKDGFVPYREIEKFASTKIHELVVKSLWKANEATFLLGGLLQRVQLAGLWNEWDGKEYETFGDWCYTVLGFRKRKADCLMLIYRNADAWKIRAEVRARLIKLGWTKAYQVCRVATEHNLEEWLVKAEQASQRDLNSSVQATLAEDAGVPESGEEAEDGDGETPTSVVDEEGGDGIKLTLTFKDTESYTAVQHTLDILSKRTHIENNGKLVNLLATSYMAMHVKDENGGFAAEIETILENLERSFGVKLIVVQKPTAKIKLTAKKKTA